MAYLSTDLSNPVRWTIVYPSYINSKKTIVEGRRIAKEKYLPLVVRNAWKVTKHQKRSQMQYSQKPLACENPTVNEIRDICQSQGLNCSIENKQYPRDSAKDALCKGRIRVQLKNVDGTPAKEAFPTKKALFLYVAEMIPKLKSRQNKSQQGDTSSSQTSTIVSNKKKKTKKGKGK